MHSPWRAYHGPSCSFLIESVTVGMALFQWQYQSLHPAMGFSLWLSSVNFGASGLTMQSSWSVLTCHFLHLKRVAVLHKSTIPLCSNTLMVMSPHFLVTVTDPFQLSLQEAHTPLPVLLPGSLYRHLLYVWTWDTVSGSCVHVSHPHSPLMTLSLKRPDPWYSSSFLLQSCLPDWQWH